MLAGAGFLLAGSTGFLVYSEVTTREQTSRLARMTEGLECATTVGRRACEQLAADRDALLGTQWRAGSASASARWPRWRV